MRAATFRRLETPAKFVAAFLVPLLAWHLGQTMLPLLTAVNIHIFTIQFLSIFLEALPFLLLGTLVSGFLEIFLSPDRLLTLVPKGKVTQAMAGSLLGFLFPVCECGSVPVVRRLYEKGLPAPMGIAFLLAAPALNPITLFSTFMAFGFGPILLGRFALTFVIAVTVALVIGGSTRETLLPQTRDVGHAHERPATLGRKISLSLSHAADEFFEMGSLLVIGCMVASVLQLLLPQSVLLPLGSGPMLSVIVLELLAFVLSLCSTVDAFVALGFASTFTGGSVVAFLVFGPMVDIKSSLMFLKVFRRKTVFLLMLIPFLLTAGFGILLNLLGLPLH